MSEPIKSVGEQIVDMFNAALIQQGVEAAYTLEDLTIGAPVAYEPGSYDVEIKAVRKNGSFDPVVVAFVAEISGGFSGVLAP